MSIDTATPRSRRAILAGAIGGVLASVGLMSKPESAYAGTDGDVVLDAVNTGAGTTDLESTGDLVFNVLGPKTGIKAEGDAVAGVAGLSSTGDGVYGQLLGGGPHPAHAVGAAVHGHGGLAGLYGTGDTSIGVLAVSNSVPAIVARNSSATNAAIVADGAPGTAIHGHANDAGGTVDNLLFVNLPASPALTGIYGSAFLTGTAIAADSASGLAVKAASSAGNAIRGHGALDGVIGESGGDKTGVVGFSGAGSAPQGPSKTGVYGEATQDAAARGVYGKATSGQGVRGEATSGVGVQGVASSGAAIRGDTSTGFALDATSTGGNAVRGTGGLDGVIGQSPGNHAGVVGFSGGSAPAGPANTGVYGEANQDATARGVSGKSTLGQAVRGETTTGVGVQAVATTGIALAATGKVTMSRSGKVTIPINVTSIDVTVAGGLSGTPLVFATLQYSRAGVWVTGARPNWPSAGKIRIYLNKGLATATPVAWMVLG